MTQKEALHLLKTGESVFLTGEPGSGKTHLVNVYIEYLRSHGIEPAITASTGIAATHLNGMTIHSWSGIGISKNISPHEIKQIAKKGYINKRIKKTHVLIIDEVSMLDAASLSVVEAVCREAKESEAPFGGIQTILVGDFFQLPPVSRQNEKVGFSFESDAWERLEPTVCYLTEQHRQEDSKFLSVLNAIRKNDFKEEHFSHLESRLTVIEEAPEGITKLFPHNAAVDKVNETELAKLETKEFSFKMTSKGSRHIVETLKKGCLSPEKLHLKKEAVVMFTKNSPKDSFVNGTLGRVIGFNDESGHPIVEMKSGKILEVEPMDWTVEEQGLVRAKVTQLPLRLAWAITVHKSQGMSLDAAIMNLKTVFEYGQGYVALSRVRSLSGLHLLGINDQALLVHPEIMEKDKGFYAQSKASAENLQKLSNDILDKKFEQFILHCDGSLKVQTPKIRDIEKKISTSEKTLALFKEGKTVVQIAKERNISKGTVLTHIEKLISEGKISADEVLSQVKPALKKSLGDIQNAFRTLDTDKLSHVHEHFKGKFSYDEIRIARITMKPSPVASA